MSNRLRVMKKGEGYTIGMTVSGGYVECWLLGGRRLIECNFYDGPSRDLPWTEQAVAALALALEWQRSGVMPLPASEP